ncbi:hypothetical protein [Legionella israelensis]|uniref:hypothetical protein n=1 Tax=Legionella israelensis TaxID=454 RepID=UPI000731DF4C|nr:hypothetical protein [Legionella israelensis]QBS10015.1 hypothetical protein E4T55_09200 [Legionella israelensis]
MYKLNLIIDESKILTPSLRSAAWPQNCDAERFLVPADEPRDVEIAYKSIQLLYSKPNIGGTPLNYSVL